MKLCRETNKPIPDFALVCPHCRQEACLDPAAAPLRAPAGPNKARPAAPSPPLLPAAPAAPPAPAVRAASPPAVAGIPSAPPPGPAPSPTLSPHLDAELQRLERCLRAGKRRGLWLGLGAAAAVLLAIALGVGYHLATVLAYASLADDSLRLDRDPSDSDRLTIGYRPLTTGRLGFRRADTGRETELLDQVAPGVAGSGEQKFEWRWSGVKEGDLVQVTYRQGWSLMTKPLSIPRPPPAQPLGEATLSGEVVDATTGKPLSGAEVRLVGTPLRTMTEANGRFRLTGAPAGTAGVEITAAGYSAEQLDHVIAAGVGPPLRVALSPGMAAGQIRIVLTWGQQPQDLDAHLEGPLPGSHKFHVYFGQKGDLKSKEFVNLDVDARKGLGPETVTVLGVVPGTYRYFVHDYTNRASKASSTLAQSGAMVKVYQKGQAHTFRGDQRSVGNIWNVCTIEVTAGGAVLHKVDQYETKLMKDTQQQGGTVALVLDVSGSMQGRRIEQAKAAALEFLNAVPFDSGGQVGLVTFGARTERLHEISKDKVSLQAAIRPLIASGGTPMHRGADLAHDMLQGVQGNRTAILFTDGIPDNRSSALAAAKRLKDSGVDVWAIGIGEAPLDFLRQMASGPDKATLADLSDLQKVFVKTAEKIYAPLEERP